MQNACFILVKYIPLQPKRANIPLLQHNMKADIYLIKLERFNLGLTQQELAKKAQISLATVQKAERGGSISPRSNKAIKDALGIK